MSKKIFQSSYASIYFDAEYPDKKIRIIVKKKDYSLAVHRNKAKRWIKEIFNMGYESNGFVVVVRQGFLQKSYADICIDFQDSLDNFVNSVNDD